MFKLLEEKFELTDRLITEYLQEGTTFTGYSEAFRLHVYALRLKAAREALYEEWAHLRPSSEMSETETRALAENTLANFPYTNPGVEFLESYRELLTAFTGT